RVLVVDDSATARRLLSRCLEGEADIQVVGEAADAASARQLVASREPDVITLDLEMPDTDGLSFLRLLMRERPTPVIVISSHVPTGSMKSIEALRAGAIDVIVKPRGAAGVAGLGAILRRKIRGLRDAPVQISPALPRASHGLSLSDGPIANGVVGI